MQAAVIEFSRNVCNLKNSNSTEFDKNTGYPVIALIEEWLDKKGSVEYRGCKFKYWWYNETWRTRMYIKTRFKCI